MKLPDWLQGNLMNFSKVSVIELAHVDAPEVITSRDIEIELAQTIERLGLPIGLLENVAGIQERRWWPADVMPSDAAAKAGELVFERSGVDRNRVGVIVNTSVCRDFIEPSTAAIVHHKLGLPGSCQNFDLGNACLAFLNAMDIVAGMIERGDIEYGLIVDGESSREVQRATIDRLMGDEITVDQFRAEFATLTLGSGGVAMLLGQRKSDTEPQYLGGVSIAATQWSGLCQGQRDQMQTDTRTLLAEGVSLAKKTYAIAQDKMGWSDGSLNELILHQVSAVHTTKLCQFLGLDPRKALLTFPMLGNIGPASLPITLSKALEAGRISSGDRVGLLGIGSGLNCAMSEIRW